MQIIGFNFTKISIEKQEKLEGKLDLKQNINIDSIEKDKISISNQEVLNTQFTFSIDYNNGDFAKVEIKGKIIILPDKNELKSILDSWKKKDISNDFKLFIFNFILSKCNIKSLQLEDELNLPFHIQLPKLNAKSQEENKTN